MEFLNTMDEQERFLNLKVYLSPRTLQADSHTVSYLFAREKWYKNSINEKIGLESDEFIEYSQRHFHN